LRFIVVVVVFVVMFLRNLAVCDRGFPVAFYGFLVGARASMFVEAFVLVWIGFRDEKPVGVVGCSGSFPGETAETHAAVYDGYRPDVCGAWIVTILIVDFGS